jgi:hypothetical protein
MTKETLHSLCAEFDLTQGQLGSLLGRNRETVNTWQHRGLPQFVTVWAAQKRQIVELERELDELTMERHSLDMAKHWVKRAAKHLDALQAKQFNHDIDALVKEVRGNGA